jgi:hypothetical protein
MHCFSISTDLCATIRHLYVFVFDVSRLSDNYGTKNNSSGLHGEQKVSSKSNLHVIQNVWQHPHKYMLSDLGTRTIAGRQKRGLRFSLMPPFPR